MEFAPSYKLGAGSGKQCVLSLWGFTVEPVKNAFVATLLVEQ